MLEAIGGFISGIFRRRGGDIEDGRNLQIGSMFPRQEPPEGDYFEENPGVVGGFVKKVRGGEGDKGGRKRGGGKS